MPILSKSRPPKPKPRKSRVRPKPVFPLTLKSPGLEPALRLFRASMDLKEAIEGARKRRPRAAMKNLILTDEYVFVAFTAHSNALVDFIEKVTLQPAVDAEPRDRPLPKAPLDPRRTPIRRLRESDEPDDEEDE